MEGSEFLEYLELQDSLDMVSKSELLDTVRSKGSRVTDRQLTTYISEGLIPKSARIGSRAGAYPKIVIELLHWIDSCRQRGLSIEAIKELIPLWKFLRTAKKQQMLDFGEFEYVARQWIRSTEAAYAVPTLLDSLLPCPVCSADELAEIKFTMKNGRIIDATIDEFVPLAFTVAQEDEEGEVEVLATTRFTMPLNFDHASDAIILGVRNGVDVPAIWTEQHVDLSSGGSSRELGPSEEEVDATEGG